MGRTSPASSAVVDQAREMLEALRSKASRASPSGRAAIERVARQVDSKLAAVEQRLSFDGERSPRMVGGQGSRPGSRGVSPSAARGGMSPRSPRGGQRKLSWGASSRDTMFYNAGMTFQSIINEASPYLCVCAVTAMLVRPRVDPHRLNLEIFGTRTNCFFPRDPPGPSRPEGWVPAHGQAGGAGLEARPPARCLILAPLLHLLSQNQTATKFLVLFYLASV